MEFMACDAKKRRDNYRLLKAMQIEKLCRSKSEMYLSSITQLQ